MIAATRWLALLAAFLPGVATAQDYPNKPIRMIVPPAAASAVDNAARIVTTPAPLPQFPEVPAVSESGLAGFEFNSWLTVMAPAGTPRDIVARLHQEIQKALADPEVRAKLVDQGLTARGTSPEELRAATREQLARYARLIREAGIKGE
ncbi:MAG: tripartite tricarboxylate transporter substrate-binding protein [Pseudomonadota bacterium]|nr:tripartite tricarboxylate transporter substrate-binding protein [Pseudomonadota bacterium]